MSMRQWERQRWREGSRSMPHDSIHIDEQGQPWSIRALLASERPRVLYTARVESLWSKYANSRRWGGKVSSPARLLAYALIHVPSHVAERAPLDFSDTNFAHACRIVRLKNAIERGENLAPLLIGPDGNMWDGLHRLAALRGARREYADILSYGKFSDDIELNLSGTSPTLADTSKTSELQAKFSCGQPFPHVYFASPLSDALAHGMAEEFQQLPWRLSSTEFYDQHEVSLLDRDWLVGPALGLFQQAMQSEELACALAEIVGARSLFVSDIACHLSEEGQSIGIHNDMSDDRETCRLTIHLTPDWQTSDGGHFVVFKKPFVDDAVAAYPPLYNTAVLFRINNSSFHAVSEVSSDQPRLSVVVAFVEA